MPALRPRRRRHSGKRWKILDLITHYWDEIDGDFATILHVDALDFVRGTRPWFQFLNYCNTIAQHVGGRLYAAQLSDPRYYAEIEKQLAEAEADDSSGRPGLAGYTAEIKALDRVANQIRLLIRAMTQTNIGFIEGPEGPADKIAARRRQLSDSLVDAALGYVEVSSGDSV